MYFVYSALQCTAVYCTVLHRATPYRSVCNAPAGHCNVLQCIAMRAPLPTLKRLPQIPRPMVRPLSQKPLTHIPVHDIARRLDSHKAIEVILDEDPHRLAPRVKRLLEVCDTLLEVLERRVRVLDREEGFRVECFGGEGGGCAGLEVDVGGAGVSEFNESSTRARRSRARAGLELGSSWTRVGLELGSSWALVDLHLSSS